MRRRRVSVRRVRRALGTLLVLAGTVHLLAPDRLLGLAGWGYRRVLAVEFRPRADATRRVRVVGVCMWVIGAVLRRRADRRSA